MIRTALNKENVTENSNLCASKNIMQRGNLYKISIIGKSTQIERRLVVRQPKGGRMESHCLMVTVCLRVDEDKIMA